MFDVRRPHGLHSLVSLLMLIVLAAYTPAASSAASGNAAQLRRYPYLTDLVDGYATINWATDRSSAVGRVTWGQVGAEPCTAHVAAGTPTNLYVNGVLLYQWRAELTLQPNTNYCYRVFLGPEASAIDLLGTDPSPAFWTQIPSGSAQAFRFAVLGDWGDPDNGAVPQAALLAHLAGSGARFAFTTGDNAYPAGSQKNYGDLVQTGTSISGVFGPNYWTIPGRSIALFPALGNHGLNINDTNHPHLMNWPQTRAVALSGGRYELETYSGHDKTTPDTYPSAWYAFDAGIARFYVLDAAWDESNLGTAASPYKVDYDYHWTPGAPEYEWLKADLAAHPDTLKFAIFHYPLHSDNAFQSSDTFLQGRGGLEDMLNNAGVLLVFNGHAHIYQRSVVDGHTSYVVGATGARLEPIDGGCSTTNAYGLGYSYSSNRIYTCGAASANPPANSSGVFHYVLVDVDPSAVTVTPIDSMGRAFDQQIFPLAPPPDTTPPGAPAQVRATLTDMSVQLEWVSATDDVGVTGYDIYRNGALLSSVGNVTSYSDATVTHDASYSYTLRARDAAGNQSAASDPPAYIATPPAPDTVAPSVPGHVTATASPSQVALKWNASTDNVGVTGYDVYRDGVLSASLNATTYTDTTVTPGTRYQYQIAARDTAGNRSARTQPLGVETPALPQKASFLFYLPLIIQ